MKMRIIITLITLIMRIIITLIIATITNGICPIPHNGDDDDFVTENNILLSLHNQDHHSYYH